METRQRESLCKAITRVELDEVKMDGTGDQGCVEGGHETEIGDGNRRFGADFDWGTHPPMRNMYEYEGLVQRGGGPFPAL